MTNRNLLILDDMIEKLELFERKMNILENLLNEAAILTTRHKKSKITTKEINESFDRLTAGIIKTPLDNTKYKKS